MKIKKNDARDSFVEINSFLRSICPVLPEFLNFLAIWKLSFLGRKNTFIDSTWKMSNFFSALLESAPFYWYREQCIHRFIKNLLEQVLAKKIRILFRDVGSISHLGGTTLRGHRKEGHFLKIKRALLCLLQILEARAPSAPLPPVPTSMCFFSFLLGSTIFDLLSLAQRNFLIRN